MILKIFTMRDEKAELFIRPFFMPNLALAVRAIEGAGRDPEHAFAKHPQDFILYELGTWDEEHAEFDLSVAPQRHGSVNQLRRPIETENENGEAAVSHETPIFDRSARGNSA